MIIFGILAQISHFIILKSFPNVCLTSLEFIAAVILLIVNHYFAFIYFGNVHYAFSEVMAYFVLWLWLVPFALFISLSANDSVLPTIAEQSGELSIIIILFFTFINFAFLF